MALSLNNLDYILYSISEKAISIEFGLEINQKTLEKIINLNLHIKSNPFPGLLNTIPAYTTLTVFFDPIELIKSPNLKGLTCYDKISNYLSNLKTEEFFSAKSVQKIIKIPVCYDDIFGLDLQELSIYYKLSKEEIIELHSSTIYTVYMIGFILGFPYLGGLPERLKAPRKQAPRKSIAAGSVGIAGKQTGIYSLESPGGWQIIGKTPVKLFNIENKQPSLLKAGDKLKFEPISLKEFERIQKAK